MGGKRSLALRLPSYMVRKQLQIGCLLHPKAQVTVRESFPHKCPDSRKHTLLLSN